MTCRMAFGCIQTQTHSRIVHDVSHQLAALIQHGWKYVSTKIKGKSRGNVVKQAGLNLIDASIDEAGEFRRRRPLNKASDDMIRADLNATASYAGVQVSIPIKDHHRGFCTRLAMSLSKGTEIEPD